MSPRILASLILLPLSAPAAPPVVKTANPDNQEVAVDPALVEIRVEFDQPMDRESGYSVTGGGETFPEVTGKPRWKDSRTFVLPVRLLPSRTYRLGINSPSHRKFQNREGEPAVPYPIEFRTAPARGSNTPPITQSLSGKNAASLRQLREAVEKHYSHRELRAVDWDAQFDFYGVELSAAPTAAAFANSAAALLGAAKDVHIWVYADITQEAKPIPSHRRNITPNYDFARLPNFLSESKKANETVILGRASPGVAYAAITSWSANREKDLDAVFGLIRTLAPGHSLVLDVRANAGGAEPLARKVAGCFITEPVHYASHIFHDPSVPNGAGPLKKRILRPNSTGPSFRGRVAVLMGPVNMSSCEAFLLMMKEAPNCALIGERSYGSSGNPQPHILANGVTVYLPSWRALDRVGGDIEGVGIAPEIEVPWKPRDESDDPVLREALELLGVNAP